MPILLGRRATPGRRFLRGRPLRSALSTVQPAITGVTKDSNGAALGNCTVMVFRTVDRLFLGEVTSDASGNYTFYPLVSGACFMVMYKTGAPDVAGTSVNTLLAA